MSYPLNNLGNGVYSQGKKLIFDVPEMLEHAGKADTPKNREELSETIRQSAPVVYPESEITIVRSRS